MKSSLIFFIPKQDSLTDLFPSLQQFSEVVDDFTELVLEVYTKGGLSGDKLIGRCKVCVPTQLEAEQLIDRVIDLELPSNIKEKHKEMLDSRMGNIHLRILYSKEHEVPLRPIPNACSIFRYRDHYRNMRTGDLILYSGIGVTDAIGKILSGTRYSRVGLVVRMPNKYTGREKLYVFEVTRNLGRELDAFREKAHTGASIYELFPRLHSASATDIWWVPLKMPLDPTSCANMLDWIKEAVLRRQTVDFPAVPHEVEDFFSRYELSLSKHPFAHAEICSASAITQALRLGGRRFPFEHYYLSCAQLISSDCFENPILIRERSAVAMPPFYPPGTDPLSASRSSSSSARRATVSVVPRDHSPGGSLHNSSTGEDSRDDNELVAPRMRPVSIAPEPQRTTTQAALLRSDSPSRPFAEQHARNSPDPTATSTAGGGSEDTWSPTQDQNGAETPYGYPEYPPPQYGQHYAPPDAAQVQRSGYRAPHGEIMPSQPPGPSVVRLPQYHAHTEIEAFQSEPAMQAPTTPRDSVSQAPAESPPSDAGSMSYTLNSTDPNEASTNTTDVHVESQTDTSLEANPPSESPPKPAAKPDASAPPEVPLKTSKRPDKPPKPAEKPNKPTARPAVADKPTNKIRPLTHRPSTVSSLDSTPDPRDRAVSNAPGPKRMLPVPSIRKMATPATGEDKNAFGGPTPAFSEPSAHSPPPADQTPTSSRTEGLEDTTSPRKSMRHTRAKSSPRSEGRKSSPRGEPQQSSNPLSARQQSLLEEDESGGTAADPVLNASTSSGPPVPPKKSKRGSKLPKKSDSEGDKAERRIKRSAEKSQVGSSSDTVASGPPPVPEKKKKKPKVPEPEPEHTSALATEAATEPTPVVVDASQPKLARMQWTFDAEAEAELSVPEGEQVIVLAVSEEWALVSWNSQKGAVPISYIEYITSP